MGPTFTRIASILIASADATNSDSPLHVAIGADRKHWPGIVGAVDSLLRNTAQPRRFHLHVFVPDGSEPAFRSFMRCHGFEMGRESWLRVASFGARAPRAKVRIKASNLESPLNFVRFYLHELLPGVAKVLYLDADVIVRGDAAVLLDASLTRGELCAAVPHATRLRDKGVSSLGGKALQQRFAQRYGMPLPLDAHGFIAGVFVFDLQRWRMLNMTVEAEYWIAANNREKLYALGSQPPLVLSILGVRGGCQALPAEWHLDCLGCVGNGRRKTAQQLAQAQLYHWNGPRKPWSTSAFRALFSPYERGGARCRAPRAEQVTL